MFFYSRSLACFSCISIFSFCWINLTFSISTFNFSFSSSKTSICTFCTSLTVIGLFFFGSFLCLIGVAVVVAVEVGVGELVARVVGAVIGGTGGVPAGTRISLGCRSNKQGYFRMRSGILQGIHR